MGQVTPGAAVYLDANILIRMVEAVQRDRDAIRAVLAAHVSAGSLFVTSELTFAEVLVHPLRLRQNERIERYNRLLTEFVEPHPVSREVLITAAKLRAEITSLRTPDAIHVATALHTKAVLFLTGDRGIKARSYVAVEYV